MTELVVRTVLQPPSEEVNDALFTEPHLVLYINAKLDILVAIPIQPRRSDGGRIYFRSYVRVSLDEVRRQCDPGPSQRLTVSDFIPRAITTLTNVDLNGRYCRGKRRISVAVQMTNLRWFMIKDFVGKEELFDVDMLRAAVRSRVDQLMANHRFLKVYKRSKESSPTNPQCLRRRLTDEVRQRLYQYWAGGSIRGALIPFTNLCGGLGKRKLNVRTKLGRHNAKTRDGEVGFEGFIVYPGGDDEKTIHYCYDQFVRRGNTERAAWNRMLREFYSDAIQLPSGKVKSVQRAPHLTPSFSQFKRVGPQTDASNPTWRRMLPSPRFQTNFRALPGSVRSDVVAPGQRGFIDSSPADIQLVSAFSRLKRIGGATSILVADSLFGYIPGFYGGLRSPSGITAKLAIYASMVPEEIWHAIEMLGLDDLMEPEDWIPMQFGNLFCDNTDLRTDNVISSCSAVGINLDFVAKMRPDLNSMAEAGHHRYHRSGPHRLPGSTRGARFKERSEQSAVDRARHNVLEFVRDQIRAIHFENTKELDIHVPLRFRERGVRPTRLELTRAALEESTAARPMNPDLARLHLLPRYWGTFSKDGVRLHNPEVHDKIEFIHPLVYVSKDVLVLRLFEEARRGGKRNPDFFVRQFVLYPLRLSRIWYLSLEGPGGPKLIELQLAVDRIQDPDLAERATFDDLDDLRDEERKARPIHHRSREQKEADVDEMRQREIEHAQDEYDAQLAAAGSLSKQELRAGRSENRADELKASIEGQPLLLPASKKVADDPPQPASGAESDTRVAHAPVPNNTTDPQHQAEASDAAGSNASSGSLLRAAARDAAAGVDDDKIN